MESTMHERSNGTREWLTPTGERHHEDGPAIEYAGGERLWYRHDELHREGGPAIERVNGERVWYRHGKLHRDDGPAVEYPDGRREWWLDGVQHKGQEVEERRLAWNKAARATRVVEANRRPVLRDLLAAAERAGTGVQTPNASAGDPSLKL
jgi:hypothetical protein